MSAISGYSDAAIDRACHRLETEGRQEFETAFPDLGHLLEHCRIAQAELADRGGKTWTVANYREARDFDEFVNERMDEGESRESVLKRFPNMAPKWVAWRNQLADGTIQCPGWCERCGGDRLLIVNKDGTPWNWRTNEKRYAKPCEACTGGRAA